MFTCMPGSVVGIGWLATPNVLTLYCMPASPTTGVSIVPWLVGFSAGAAGNTAGIEICVVVPRLLDPVMASVLAWPENLSVPIGDDELFDSGAASVSVAY